MAKLACPGCGAPYAAGEVNLELGVGACKACGEVHELAARPLSRRSPADPAGLEVADDAVRIPWRSGPQVLFLGLFCLVWDGILATMFATALASGELQVLVFGSLHGAVGVGLTWLFVATLVNTTEVKLGRGEVTVSHGPVPWFGHRRVDRDDVRQIYVIEDVGSKGARSWSVHAQLANGHPVQLLRGLTSPGRARFVEDWLERGLGVADEPVAGELS